MNERPRSQIFALGSFLALLVVAVAVILVVRSGGGGDSSSDLTDTSVKPVIDVPSDPPPADLVQDDIVTGDGTEAKSGDQLTVQYVGVDYATGQEFDTSWGKQPFEFQLDAGMVIPGWDQGIVGMKVGGRRELTIPPAQAYGAQGQPPTIAPNSTLVFVVDLLDVKAGADAGSGAGAGSTPPPGG